MASVNAYRGGESFDLRKVFMQGRSLRLSERVEKFRCFLGDLSDHNANSTLRCVTSAADREVTVWDPGLRKQRRMLMFGSNNYLGLANHPRVRARAQAAIREYGAGIGGPPLLNGYTALHKELEERIAALKGAESALLFSSGFSANVGLVAGLARPQDTILYDVYSHASFCDGVEMAGAQSFHFRHNDVAHLRGLLEQHRARTQGDIFVGVEGVYSMDGDIAPLDTMLKMCTAYGATLILDDAHGTGVMGPCGRGTAEHFGLDGGIPVTMGTFSKTFAVTGGFVASSRAIVEYLRYFARPYMFSASLSPVTIATVLAGMDVMEQEPALLERLRANVRYAAEQLREVGYCGAGASAILALRVPAWMNIRQAAHALHVRNIFVNSIEYPAVPLHQQRFRISIMATHTREDIDRLCAAVEEVWRECGQAAA